MGYWGWRPLILGLFISTWVVGCNVVSDHASPSTSPSPYPSVTLTIGRLASPRAAPTRVAMTPIRTTSPDDPAGSLTAHPLVLDVPTCYETPGSTLLCLGMITNPLDYPVESVVVEVQLATQIVQSLVEQRVIPPGGVAPYGAVLDARGSTSSDSVLPAARLIAALPAVDPRWITLDTEAVELAAAADGRIIITAEVVNSGNTPAEAVRAVVTLLDEDERVIGYRVLTFGGDSSAGSGVPLNARERFPLRVIVTPQFEVDMERVQYHLYIEGRKLDADQLDQADQADQADQTEPAELPMQAISTTPTTPAG